MSIETFKIGEQDIKIFGEYDVLIVGGGPAGIAAAVSASRLGAKTILIEKYGFLGGMASAGMVGSFCGFFTSGPKKQLVVGGVGRDLVKQLADHSGITGKLESAASSRIAQYRYNPEVFKYVAETMVLAADVEILFHTIVVETICNEEGLITGIILENKSGKSAVLGKIFIDGTGDGDIAVKAGAYYEIGDKNGVTQSMTTMFRLTNSDYNKAKKIDLNELRAKLENRKSRCLYKLERVDGVMATTIPKGMINANVTGISKFSALDAKELTKAEIEGRRQVFEYLRFLRENLPGFENAEIAVIGTQIGVRETRRILGDYVLNEKEVLKGTKFENGIALGAWPVELHDSESGRIKWEFLEKEDDYYSIPIECLIPKKTKNVIVAGRCISTTHIAQASTRVIAQSFATGEAAGVMAAQCIDAKCKPAVVNKETVKKTLIKNGAILNL